MIALEDALRIVLENTDRLPPRSLPLTTAAGGWLAEDVVSDVDLPPADVSAMDGFALRSADLADPPDPPVSLEIVGEIAAGATPEVSVGPGQAVRIMTGAPLPQGADAVQMVEHTEAVGEDQVRVLRPVESGRHIRRRGENLRRGELILPAGCRLGPAEIGLLATAGVDPAPVGPPPRVALLPTGDELVEPQQTPGPGQIRNSNGPTLAALLGAEGAAVEYLGIAPDEPAGLDRMVADGLERDVLILSGGVSMGIYDLVTGILRNRGVEIRFERIAIKPGKPTVFGVHGPGRLVFGLPGNPVSSMVVARLLVVPALRRLRGASKVVDELRQARLVGRLDATTRREAFHPARVTWTGSGYLAEPVSHRGSGDLVAWRAANGMIRLPPDVGAEDGDPVQVLLDRDHDLR